MSGKDINEIGHLLDETIAKGERSYLSMPISELIVEHQRLVVALKSCDPVMKGEIKEQMLDLTGYIARRQKAQSLSKALSFDPTNPIEMNADQTFYNPYRHLEDGSYAPHSSAYWMEQTGTFSNEARADGYREVNSFYRQAGVMKAVLDVEIDLLKAVSPAKLGKPKKKLEHHERMALVKHHLKKRKLKEKMDNEASLDKKIKQHVDSTLADHFETHKIRNKVHATMQKRLSAMGPNQRSQLHQSASGLNRPATPEETSWSGIEPRTKAKKPKPEAGI